MIVKLRGVIVSPTVYPSFFVIYDFSFFPVNSETTQFISQNPVKNIPVDLPSSRIKIWGKLLKGSWVMIEQANKRTNKQILQLYNYRYYTFDNWSRPVTRMQRYVL